MTPQKPDRRESFNNMDGIILPTTDRSKKTEEVHKEKPLEEKKTEEVQAVEEQKETTPSSGVYKMVLKTILLFLAVIAIITSAVFFISETASVERLYIDSGEQDKYVKISEDNLTIKESTQIIETKYNQSLSLVVPSSIDVYMEEKEDKQIFIFQNSKEEEISFQIVVEPYDGVSRLVTSSQIQEKVPGAQLDTLIQDEVGDGIKTLTFFAENEKRPITREVWVIKGSVLYQITTYKSFDEEMSQIFSTLKFK